MKDYKDYQGRIFVGILIIGLGIIFLLGSLDKLDIGHVFSIYWPMFLIFLGLWQLVANNFRNAGFGLILIVIGVFFQLVNWDILGFNVWNILWPILIICVGLWLIFKPRFRGLRGQVPEIRENDLGVFIIFSGVKRRIESRSFKGGKSTALLGSVQLDFAPAALANDEATVELTSIFGSHEIWVPREWKVVVDSSAIFGSVEDKTVGASTEKGKTTLYVKATALFGSVEIKN